MTVTALTEEEQRVTDDLLRLTTMGEVARETIRDRSPPARRSHLHLIVKYRPA